MYENQAFGDSTREWGDLDIDGPSPNREPAETIEWLRSTHAIFRNSVARLEDSQLTELSPWGAPWTNTRIIEIMIQHPLYHIGEINYARALLQNNNDWHHQDIGRDPEE